MIFSLSQSHVSLQIRCDTLRSLASKVGDPLGLRFVDGDIQSSYQMLIVSPLLMASLVHSRSKSLLHQMLRQPCEHVLEAVTSRKEVSLQYLPIKTLDSKLFVFFMISNFV